MKPKLISWEFRHLRADAMPWLLAATLALTCAFALVNGARQHRFLGEALRRAEADGAAQTAAARATADRLNSGEEPDIAIWRDVRYVDTYANNRMANYATRPPLALTALTVGQSDLFPAVLKVTPGSLDNSLTGVEFENPHRLLLGRLDAAFVVIYLLPLFILALTYNLVSGERERGTLPLVAMNPVSFARLLATKVVVRAALLLGVGGITLVAGLAAGGFIGGEPSAWVRLAVWIMVAVVYGALWFGLALLVTVRGRASAANAIVVAALWLGFVVIVPTLVNVAAKTFFPVPSRIEQLLALRTAGDEATNKRSKLVSVFYEDHPELAPKSAQDSAPDWGLLGHLTYLELEHALAPVRARHAERLARQQEFVDGLKFLSPALLTQSIFADLAGTGVARQRRFLAQAEEHHFALRTYFQPRILAQEKFDGFERVPAFMWQEEPTGVVFARIASPAVAISLLAVGAFVAAAIFSRRIRAII